MIREIVIKMVKDLYPIPYNFALSPKEFEYVQKAEKELGVDLLPEEKI